MKIYCMSDIHGCYSALCDALELVIDHLDEPDTKLIFLGDYIHGGEDSRNGAGQHDAQNHPQFARAQGHGSLLVGAGHREEAFLSGADDGRQDTEGHGQAAGQNGGSHAEHYAEHRVAEQAEQNRGDAGQNLRGKPDGPHQPPLLSVLSQINGG